LQLVVYIQPTMDEIDQLGLQAGVIGKMTDIPHNFFFVFC